MERPDSASSEQLPALVTLHVWGLSTYSRVPSAVLRMATDRHRVRQLPGLRFAKLLGTGDGRTFTPRDSDPMHWALLSTWDSDEAAARFESSEPARGWGRLASERLRVQMRPLSTRGRWSGTTPFGDPQPRPYEGAVAAVTRARLSWRRARTFWRAVPAVSAELSTAPGLRLALGIGEAPVGLQGTFSLWSGAADLAAFAYERAAHREAIRRTAEVAWYREELFARFAVVSVEGRYRDREP
jgi:hypothetical protein